MPIIILCRLYFICPDRLVGSRSFVELSPDILIGVAVFVLRFCPGFGDLDQFGILHAAVGQADERWPGCLPGDCQIVQYRWL